MTLTSEQWKKILDTINPNKGDIFEQIKENLNEKHQEVYQEWKQKGFDVNCECFSVKSTVNDDFCRIRFTLLHMAAFIGQSDIVEYFVENGANVNAETEYGNFTCLHLAARCGNLDIVKYLIEKQKVDINAKNKNNNTPLHEAACLGHLATQYGRLEIVNALLEKGADVNAKGNYGDTPLLWATQYGRLEIVNALLEKGADVNVKNEYGNTPLHLATQYGRLEIVNALLEPV